MNRLTKIALVAFFSLIASRGFAKSSGDLKSPQPKNNDTNVTTKSNIVIFKMIPTPTPSNTNSNSGGSLKKAGKVARTSTSRS